MQTPQAEELRGYLARPITEPAPGVVEAISRGPIHPEQALDRTELDRLLDPAPLDAETGWRTLPDGVAYAAVRTEMPGVNADMVDWWFDWHQRDPIRYQIWFLATLLLELFSRYASNRA
jgi:DAPG hydrolase PhiG domain